MQAIPLVNTELEMAHLFGLRDSALGEQLQIKRIPYTWKRSPDRLSDSIAEWQYSELQYCLADAVWVAELRNSNIVERLENLRSKEWQYGGIAVLRSSGVVGEGSIIAY